MKSVNIKIETLPAVGSSAWFGFRSSLNPSLWSSSKRSRQRSTEQVGRTRRQREDPLPAGSVRLARFQTHDSLRDSACRASANARHNPESNVWTATLIMQCGVGQICWPAGTEPNDQAQARRACGVGRHESRSPALPGAIGSVFRSRNLSSGPL